MAMETIPTKAEQLLDEIAESLSVIRKQNATMIKLTRRTTNNVAFFFWAFFGIWALMFIVMMFGGLAALSALTMF